MVFELLRFDDGDEAPPPEEAPADAAPPPPPAGADAPPPGPPPPPRVVYDFARYMPIFILTGVFASIFIFVPIFVRKCPNKGVIRTIIMMSAFSCWIFWVTMYIAQLNPLVGPRVNNLTLIWMTRKYIEAKYAPPPGAGPAPPADAAPEAPPAPAEEAPADEFL